MCMDDIKLFAKNEKGLKTLQQTVRIYSQDKGMEFGMESCTMLIMSRGKRQTMEVIELPNQEKNQNAPRKGNSAEIANIGSRHHQTSRNERKTYKKSISGERKTYSKPSYIAEVLSKG